MMKSKIIYTACFLFFIGTQCFLGQDKKPNVLFIISDQLRWDAISCAGNLEIETPNIDRIAKEGVQFSNAYAACPVCVPARTSILTGKTIFNTKVLQNRDANSSDVPDISSFDQILAKNGYHTEYYGKWHAPYKFTSEYENVVKTTGNIKIPNVSSTVDDYRRYVDELGIPVREPKANEVIDRKSLRPYVPLPMDAQYKKNDNQKYLGQGSVFGVLQTPAEASLGAYMGNEALQALKKIKTDQPFSLTLSIGPPHPPFIIPEKYASLFDPEEMSVPMSIGDDLLNAPYERSNRAYDTIFQNPKNIQQMKALYYGMVVQVDNWVGKLLDELDRKGVTDNTLVVFTSDHGELLGDHGMSGKAKMYEGSAHIPLLMRLPSKIPAGTRIENPVSHHDIYSTILDYAGTDIPSNDGYSLRKLIENEPDTLDYTVSVWGDIEDGGPFMIRQGDWKLIVYLPISKNSAKKTNALYNLTLDPLEMNNLIGTNPEKPKYVEEARNLKKTLRDWMIKTKTPYLKELDKISI